ncbi:MAG TPA: hypothetical protein VL325_05305, partial [Pyrinomonadaceae bacterium]|nr:hypothetical protein [Pyrinomonadaceae bacterium]
MNRKMSADGRLLGKHFCFESYGVTIRVESHRADLLEEAERTVRKALVGQVRIIDNQETEHVFGVGVGKDGWYFVRDNDEIQPHSRKRSELFKYLDTLVRLRVAEFAVGRVFVHAGVVGWNGKAILFPANSRHGKTTLTAELVRNGATYYSDDYAVLDIDGFVHPFARLLSVRQQVPEGQPGKVVDVDVRSLGGTAGSEPLPVGFVLLTEFKDGARWRPKILSPGEGMIEMITQTIPIRRVPEFSLKVLKKITTRATIAKGFRNDAKDFAK